MSGSILITKKTGELIDTLRSIKFMFSREYASIKREIIEDLSEREITAPSHILGYHEALCFMQAYPDSRIIRNLVDSELEHFYLRIERFRDLYGDDDERIEDYGLVDTFIRYQYNYIMANWLVKNYGNDVEIDWDFYSENEKDPLSGLLNIFALYVENDGVDNEDLSTEDWIKGAVAANQTALQWILRKLDSLKAPFDIKQYLYDNAELMLKWHLGKSRAASTLAMSDRPVIYFQNRPMKKQRFDLRRAANSQIPAIRLLSEKEGKRIIETQILALLPRHRELYPVLYANPAEVYVTSPGRGLEIYMVGMKPENRMPLETNYSGLLIKNGVPIGYAISVLLFERCEIAINVFDTFRSGEASIIFNHFLKVFYHHFGGRAFIMRKWQVGHENEEGLKSGSFWFYYKLGFRPIDPEVGELAKIESAKISKDKSYRSDIRTLKRLALSDMLVDLRPKPRRPFKEMLVSDIGMAVTEHIARNYRSDSVRALRNSLKAVKSVLGIRNLNKWPVNERVAFERWCPMLTLIEDLNNWNMRDKRKLIEIIKAKADIKEKRFVGLMQKHAKFQESLLKIAQSE